MMLSRIHERESRRNGYGYIGLSRNERPHQIIRWKKFNDDKEKYYVYELFKMWVKERKLEGNKVISLHQSV